MNLPCSRIAREDSMSEPNLAYELEAKILLGHITLEDLEEALEAARKAERERCLAICERVFKDPPLYNSIATNTHQAAIRRVTREINMEPIK